MTPEHSSALLEIQNALVKSVHFEIALQSKTKHTMLSNGILAESILILLKISFSSIILRYKL